MSYPLRHHATLLLCDINGKNMPVEQHESHSSETAKIKIIA